MRHRARPSCNERTSPPLVRAASARDVCAAIDLGTNNCRLLVARPAGEGFRVVDSFSRIIRLGEGLSASGRLSEAAMSRAFDALAICAEKMHRRGVARWRAVATEACRRAENRAHFVDRVRRQTGIALEVIGQEEEARLALRGCTPLLDVGIRNALIFDIGGGSTEVCWLRVGTGEGVSGRPVAEASRLLAWYSMPIGVVDLAERHGGHTITPAAYAAMVAESLDTLAPFATQPEVRCAMADGGAQMLGTSGTVTTLAGVYKNLPRYDRNRVDGCDLDFDTVKAVSERIAGMSYNERACHPCIGGQRADLVIAGCAILEAICRTWPVGRLRVADRGLREGMLLDMMHPTPASRAAAPWRAGSRS